MSESTPQDGLSYKDAGVDIDAGNALVKRIGSLVKATQRPGSPNDIGGFGSLFDLKAAGYDDPLLVSGTDGVGTKLMVAIESGNHKTVGIDLVAMCVNDLVVQGAEPLFFLDYFATGHLSVETAADVIAGIAQGCKDAGCALIGGETAEMPGMYPEGHYDLAGFAVGAVNRQDLLPNFDAMTEGDIIIGLASSGVHSNGYSLVRKVVERSGLRWDDACPFEADKTLAEALLEPTKLYIKSSLAGLKAGGVTGLCHITGGGFTENLPRVLPDHLSATIDTTSWHRPAVFDWLQTTGNIAEAEMLRTFNCGIGMVLFVKPESLGPVTKALAELGEDTCFMGQLTTRESDNGCVLTNVKA